MPTSMTEQDLKDAQAIADELLTIATKHRPPAAVAALALALAGTTHLAECGPQAAINLFNHYFKRLDELQRSS